MEHEFILMIDGALQTFTNYDDIPEKFDHVIKFKPFIPRGPHTPEQHADAEIWQTRLQELMVREKRLEAERRRKR